MMVYVFGNKDIEEDKNAFLVAEYLEGKIEGVDFKFVGIEDEISFETEKPIIMDVVLGIDEVTLFDDIDKVILPPRVSAHDMDLGFQLKYLKKIGKIKQAMIIGVPMEWSAKQTAKYYERVISILRKLVAQDIQGS
jgi:hypothetical protein